jgi:hypothetical protein
MPVMRAHERTAASSAANQVGVPLLYTNAEGRQAVPNRDAENGLISPFAVFVAGPDVLVHVAQIGRVGGRLDRGEAVVVGAVGGPHPILPSSIIMLTQAPPAELGLQLRPIGPPTRSGARSLPGPG